MRTAFFSILRDYVSNTAPLQLVVAVFPDDLFNIFFRFYPRNHNLVAALDTTQFEVHAGAQHKKPLVPAGMGFFHFQNIVLADIHKGTLLR